MGYQNRRPRNPVIPSWAIGLTEGGYATGASGGGPGGYRRGGLTMPGHRLTRSFDPGTAYPVRRPSKKGRRRYGGPMFPGSSTV